VKRRFAEALSEVKRALDLDPLSLHMNAALVMACYFARHYEEGIEHGRKTVETDANFYLGHHYLGLAYAGHGQYSEAVEAMQKAVVLSSNSTLTLAALGAVFAFWGKAEEARKILTELELLSRRKYVSQTSVAAIYAGLGENDRALTCLEQGCADRCNWLPHFVATDARFDRLREEARFQDLARRIGIA
jgi:tetratricopeptide (TPR) repeat protein